MLGDHLMHVRLAKRAQRETKSDDTRRLAERIEKDLGDWADRWERFADRRNANVTSHLEREQRDKVQRLDKASEKKNFDQVYAEIVANHLESLVSRLRAEEREDRAGAVGRLAEKEIPVIRDLLGGPGGREGERVSNEWFRPEVVGTRAALALAGVQAQRASGWSDAQMPARTFP